MLSSNSIKEIISNLKGEKTIILTCFNNKERMVVHAVLIEVNGNEAVPTTQVEDITESPTITTFTTP